MKNILFALAMCLILSACRGRVYWLSGAIETNGVQSRCAQLEGLKNVLKLRSELNNLVNQSFKEEGPEQLEFLAKEIFKLSREMKALLVPEYTFLTYPVTYRFKIQKAFLPEGSQVILKEFSLMGERVFEKDLKLIDHDTSIDVILNRPASLLEICALSETAQGLVGIDVEPGQPSFYYRLYMDSKQ
jgi:hypothetical protein